MSNTPLAKPPPGLSEHDLNSSRNTIAMAVVLSIFASMAVGAFCFRIYAKVKTARKLGLDDLTCLLGLMGSIVCVVMFCIESVPGPIGKHMWNVTVAEWKAPRVARSTFVAQFIAPLSLLFIKSAVFFFYLELFRPLKWVRRASYTGIFINVGFYGSIVIFQLYCLTPRPGETLADRFASSWIPKAAETSLPGSAVGLVIDIVLLIIPIRAIHQLQMARERKIRLMLIFTVGFSAVLGGLLTLAYKIKTYHKLDFSYNGAMVVFFNDMEILLGTCIACTPVVYGLAIKAHPKALFLFQSVTSSFRSLRDSASSITRSSRKSHSPTSVTYTQDLEQVDVGTRDLSFPDAHSKSVPQTLVFQATSRIESNEKIVSHVPNSVP